ncbi:MAG: BF3164 family lipoprotein [Microscillaceae bacterium]|nr:BF3164 family lipoprotein [Microscillaceae bacterium]
MFNLNSAQLIKKFGRIGEAPNEFQFPTFMQYYPSKQGLMMGLYAARKFTYTEFQLDSVLFSNDPKPFAKSVTFDFNHQRLFKLDGKRFVGVGLFSHRFVVSDKEGKILQSFFDYPHQNDLDEFSHRVLAMAYQGNLIFSSDRSKFAFATIDSPNLDICKITPQRIEKVKNFHLNPPDFRGQGGSTINVTMTTKNKVGFIDICADKSHIYVLYSGRNWERHKDKYLQGNTVLVFDWEGNPVKAYQLSNDISTFTIDSRGKMLYGFEDIKNPQILTFDLQ